MYLVVEYYSLVLNAHNMIDIVGKRKIWFSISGVVLAFSVIVTAMYGLRLGIDFTGGSLLEMTCTTQPQTGVIEKIYTEKGVEGAIVQHIGETGVLIRSKEVTPDTHKVILPALQETLKNEGCVEVRFETIGPSISQELRQKSLAMIGAVVLAIILYVAWTFRSVSKPVASWKYGVVAVIALLHDVTLPTAVFALLGHYAHIEVDVLFVTALLTVMGFSVHDTIVVFDRVRESLQRNTSISFVDTVNESVNTTLGRSINTSFTTVLSLIGIFILTTGSIKYFSAVMIMGILVGTYSSIFIAAPLLVTWYLHSSKK